MTQQHPITPSSELVQKWIEEGPPLDQPKFVAHFIATRAAQWGADQELEACVAWLDGFDREGWAAEQLRADRRPKPPSLKRVALLQLDVITKDLAMHGLGCDLSQIRRALESIPDHTSEGD